MAFRASLLALLGLLWLIPATAGMAAIAPKVSGQNTPQFTRLSFDWPEKVRFKVQTSGNKVTLIFDKPTALTAADIEGRLGSKLASVAVTDGGKRAELVLDKEYKIRQFVSGNKTGFDLIGEGKETEETAQKKEAELAESAQKAFTEESANQPEANLTAKPEKEASPKPEIKKDAEKPAPKPEKKEPPKEKVAETSEPKKESATPKVDVKKAAATPVVSSPAPTPDSGKANPAEALVPAKQAEPSVTEPIASTPPTEKTELKPEAPAPAATPAAPVDTKEIPSATTAKEREEKQEPQKPAKTETTKVQAQEKKTESKLENTTSPLKETKETTTTAASATNAALDEFTDEDKTKGENSETAEEETLKESAASETVAPTSTTPEERRAFIVLTRPEADGSVNLYFPWRDRVGAAIFRRENAIFLVFNKPGDPNIELLQSSLPGAVNSAAAVTVPGHTVIRLDTDGSLYARPEKDSSTQQWFVKLTSARSITTKPIDVQLVTKSKKPSVRMSVLEYATPVSFADPVYGDTIIASPFFSIGEGNYPARDFVDFTLLESIQGTAIVRKTDSTKLLTGRTGLRVASDSGLSLSADLPALSKEDTTALGGQLATFFPYEQWQIKPGQFSFIRHEIEAKLVGANEMRRSTLLLKLVQLNLGQGLAQEAAGLAEAIRLRDEGFYKDRKLAALQGAANFLMNRVDEAAINFSAPELDNNEEAEMWRGALALFTPTVASNDTIIVDGEDTTPKRPAVKAGFDYVKYYDKYIAYYPPKMRMQLAILAADNYINNKQYNKALKVFDSLQRKDATEADHHYMEYLIGKAAAETGNFERAEKMWRPLAEQYSDAFIRVRADFALTNMLYTQGKIDAKEALKRLDRLRIVWRGDTFERDLLSELGQLYIDNKQYLDGMRAFKEVIVNYPTSPNAFSHSHDLGVLFEKLYLEGLADTMEPLTALATFYEFRDLTPIGEKGDKMIQGLADRLASVDLLENASTLLEHQIKFRLSGEDRSRVGARLALLYLLNKQPQKSIEALKLTGYGENPPELDLSRKHLAAMALSEAGDHQAALEQISDDSTLEGKHIRLNTYWKMKDWMSVITAGEDILDTRSDITAPLTDEETDVLLRTALAYSFERDSTQLRYLQNYFKPLLKDGPSKEAFMYITNDDGALDPSNFQQVAAQISRIEGYLKAYRQKVADGELSKAIQ